MNRNQVKGRADQEKGKEATGKVTGDKSTEYKGKVEKRGGETETVLSDINEDAEKHDDKRRPGSGNTSGEANKHGNKDETVLGEINDDDRKGNH